jgi:hypothetical protein
MNKKNKEIISDLIEKSIISENTFIQTYRSIPFLVEGNKIRLQDLEECKSFIESLNTND